MFLTQESYYLVSFPTFLKCFFYLISRYKNNIKSLSQFVSIYFLILDSYESIYSTIVCYCTCIMYIVYTVYSRRNVSIFNY